MTKNRVDYYITASADAVQGASRMTYHAALSATAQLAIYEEKRQELLRNLNRETLLHEYQKGKTEFSVEYQRQQKGRPVIWALTQCKTFADPDNGDIMCFVYNYNISEQKLPQEMIHTVVNLNYDYMAILNCNTNEYTVYTQSNSSILPFHTSAYADEVEQFARQYVVAEDIARYIKDMSVTEIMTQLQHKDVFTGFYRIRDEGSSVRRKQMQFSYLNRINKQVLITRVDITDIYLRDQENIQRLEAAMANAQQANIAKTEFLSRMSHDLRTPMNAIIGLTALARDDTANPAAIDQYLDKISSAGTFLLGLVNDCLDIEKISSGKMELHPVPYTYEEFANSINTMFHPLCIQKISPLYLRQRIPAIPF